MRNRAKFEAIIPMPGGRAGVDRCTHACACVRALPLIELSVQECNVMSIGVLKTIVAHVSEWYGDVWLKGCMHV